MKMKIDVYIYSLFIVVGDSANSSRSDFAAPRGYLSNSRRHHGWGRYPPHPHN